MKVLLLIHSFIMILGALIAGIVFSPHHGIWFFSGGLLMGANVWVIGTSLKWLILKKTVALAISVIVLKYAILIGLLFALTRMFSLNPLAFLLGCASLTLSALIWTIAKTTREDAAREKDFNGEL